MYVWTELSDCKCQFAEAQSLVIFATYSCTAPVLKLLWLQIVIMEGVKTESRSCQPTRKGKVTLLDVRFVKPYLCYAYNDSRTG